MKGFKINIILCILICLLIIVFNTVVEHYYAPHGMDFTPFLIVVVTLLLNVTENKFNIWLRIIFTYLFIGINDIGIKLYGGGMHDVEGQSFVSLFLMMGLIPGFIIIAIMVIRNKKLSLSIKTLSLLTFLILIGLHIYFFRNLGIGRYYPIYELP